MEVDVDGVTPPGDLNVKATATTAIITMTTTTLA
jgi:hypothetical protein